MGLRDVEVSAEIVEFVRGGFELLQPRLLRQRREADAVDSWLKPETTRGFSVPPKASREHRALADLRLPSFSGHPIGTDLVSVGEDVHCEFVKEEVHPGVPA